MYLEEVLAVVTAEDVVVAAEPELDTVVSTLEPIVELFISISKIVLSLKVIFEFLHLLMDSNLFHLKGKMMEILLYLKLF